MTLKSMTGFGTAEGEWQDFTWAWQVKSVNGKGLQVHLRLPPDLESRETVFRKQIANRIARGSVQASLTLDRAGEDGNIRINHALVQALLEGMKPHMDGAVTVLGPRLDGLLSLPGVVERDTGLDEKTLKNLAAALQKGLESALESLDANRRAEGKTAARDLSGHLEELDRQMQVARSSNGARLDTIRDRIAARLEELLKDTRLDESRLEQEAAQLAIKADVSEEMDRMAAHLKAAQDLMAEDAPVGRRFDFLFQEMNREATTLTAKAQDMDLKQAGLAMKAAIDRLREQIQNVE